VSAYKQSTPKKYVPFNDSIYLHVFMRADYTKNFTIPDILENSLLEFLGNISFFILLFLETSWVQTANPIAVKTFLLTLLKINNSTYLFLNFLKTFVTFPPIIPALVWITLIQFYFCSSKSFQVMLDFSPSLFFLNSLNNKKVIQLYF
jgi:hypothetical protein